MSVTWCNDTPPTLILVFIALALIYRTTSGSLRKATSPPSFWLPVDWWARFGKFIALGTYVMCFVALKKRNYLIEPCILGIFTNNNKKKKETTTPISWHEIGFPCTGQPTNPSKRSHLLLPRSPIPTGLTQHGTMNPKMPKENKENRIRNASARGIKL